MGLFTLVCNSYANQALFTILKNSNKQSIYNVKLPCKLQNVVSPEYYLRCLVAQFLILSTFLRSLELASNYMFLWLLPINIVINIYFKKNCLFKVLKESHVFQTRVVHVSPKKITLYLTENLNDKKTRNEK